jgi:intracellular sulfur oxidation DsrE/DsrF family protein
MLLAAAACGAALAQAPAEKTAAPAPAPYPSAANYDALRGQHDMRIVFDVTEGNPKVLAAKLATIDVTRRQLIDVGVAPHFVITFRGDASYFTQLDAKKVKREDRKDYEKVMMAIRQLRKEPGLESLEQCSLPLPSRKIDKADVMPEVKVVPNGWIALGAYQQKGYAYIAP